MTRICGGRPSVFPIKASKYALKPRTRDDRSKLVRAAYLRDRDFDFLPADDGVGPVIDAYDDDNTVLGWRWRRHSIENYILDPEIVGRALTALGLHFDRQAYNEALILAGKTIACYQAARWTIGQKRAALPSNYKLNTGVVEEGYAKPEDAAMTKNDARDWLINQCATFSGAVVHLLDKQTVEDAFNCFVSKFNTSICQSTDAILVNFSGKDLMTALADWRQRYGMPNPGDLCDSIKRWMMDNSDEVITALPEWRALIDVLRR